MKPILGIFASMKFSWNSRGFQDNQTPNKALVGIVYGLRTANCKPLNKLRIKQHIIFPTISN